MIENKVVGHDPVDTREILLWEERAADGLLEACSYEERRRIYSWIYDEDNAFWLKKHGRTGISGICARDRPLLTFACPGVGPILDIGGGNGIVGDAFPGSRRYVVCDASHIAVVFERRSDESMALRSRVVGCATELPFSGESFEAVLVLDVLEHLHADDMDMCIAEARRVLCPGGRLLLASPSRISGPWDLRRESPEFHERMGLHVNEMTVGGMLKLVRRHRFRARAFLTKPFRGWMFRVPPLSFWAAMWEGLAALVPWRYRPRLWSIAIVLAEVPPPRSC